MGYISIERCEDYREENVLAALERTFENLGGIGKYVTSGTRVAIKPNLVMKKSPEEAATTHPAVIKALCTIIGKAGGVVTIVESPGGPYNELYLKSVYSGCGMEKVAKELGIKLNYNLDEVDVENPDGQLLKKVRVLKPLMDADIIINVPKLKTHAQMVYTGAVKNMFGAIPGILKADYHFRMAKYDHFANCLIDIFLSVKPRLTIMDAIIGMDGNGPTSGDPKQIGLVLAGEDAFKLDYTALTIAGVDPLKIPLIREAVRRDLCPENIEEIERCGCDINDVKIGDFNAPQLENLIAIEFFDKGIRKFFLSSLKPKPVFNHNTCIGCRNCEKHCPAHVIKMKNHRPYAELAGCIRCFCCQELCPVKAVAVKRPFLSKILFKERKNSN